MERKTSVDPKIEQIIGQYRKVAGAFEVLFSEIMKRTEWEAWRIDGFGSCGIPRSTSEVGLNGIAKDELIRLRDQLNNANGLPRVEGKITCPYHRANHGCVLGDLKSPLCIGYIENKNEVSERFGISPYNFKQFVYGSLGRILFVDENDDGQINPDRNNDFVAETIEKIELMTERVKRTPVGTFPRVKFISAAPEYA